MRYCPEHIKCVPGPACHDACDEMTKVPDNCIDCNVHEVQPDPDPHDWFCDDDVKVVCMTTGQNITVACRPYQTRKECARPSWCPRMVKANES